MEERPARVVVVGSVNEDVLVRVDRLPLPGETVLARSAERSAGGKGANQAVAAARFGARVRFVGAVGDDASGQRLWSGLVADGIEIELATRSGVETGAAWVMVDGDGVNSIVVIPGANAELVPDHVVAALADLEPGDVVVLQCEIPDRVVLTALAAARAAGAQAILNLAPYRALELSDRTRPELVIVNRNEAAMLLGRAPEELDAASAAHELACRVGCLVIVTIGELGSVLSDGHRAAHIAAIVADAVVDTTGAGDAFVGVVAAAMAEGMPLSRAAGLGSAAASLSVRTAGAQPSYPARAEIDALVDSAASIPIP